MKKHSEIANLHQAAILNFGKNLKGICCTKITSDVLPNLVKIFLQVEDFQYSSFDLEL